LFYAKFASATSFGSLLAPSLDLVARYDDIKSEVGIGGLFYSEKTELSLILMFVFSLGTE